MARIAQLAECDIELTKLAIAHLLYAGIPLVGCTHSLSSCCIYRYYQVVMMIDIFQYSNMYTLRKSIQWLAKESDVREECGPYATKPGQSQSDGPAGVQDAQPQHTGREIADWPRLLHLYSRLKPGKTVREWMVEHDVDSLGVDVRRFTSFGVIKVSPAARISASMLTRRSVQGFLRRVHRWPILLSNADTPSGEKPATQLSLGRKRGKTFTAHTHPQSAARPEPDATRARGRPQEALPTMAQAGAELVPVQPSRSPILQRTSAAESSLEQLSGPATRGTRRSSEQPAPARRFGGSSSLPSAGIRVPPDAFGQASSADSEPPAAATATAASARPRISRSPSAPAGGQGAQGAPPYPPELAALLDGEHHTDELCTRFGVGWPVLKQWLAIAGEGKGDDDLGQVSIIYR